MTGLYILAIFLLGAALSIAVWVYNEEKERHRSVLEEYERVIDGLSNDVSALKEQIFKANIAYLELEQGRNEQDENYQQELLDAVELHNIQVFKISALTDEIRLLKTRLSRLEEDKKNTR